MTTTIEIKGTCKDGFQRVKEAFASNLEDRGEVGASLAVMVDGEMVVDLWGGYADGQRTRPWERDTIVNTYSTTKGMTAICANKLVEQGEARPRGAGRQILAGVCAGGQGRVAREIPAQPQGWAAGSQPDAADGGEL